jgi:hypothetical protein
MSISPLLARHIIENLGTSGTPPARGVQHFNVGNQSLLNALEEYYFSSYLQDGGGAYKIVVGEYGSGKSHFLYCLQDLAWNYQYAVAKVDLSPVETPYNDQRLVYAAVARNLIWHEKGEEIKDERGLTRFLEGTLSRFVGNHTLDALSHPNYIALVETIEKATIESLAYKRAILGYFEALLRRNEDRLDSVTRWLMGEVTSPDDTKLLRRLGVTEKISRPNAFRMLRSLVQTIRELSYNGLVLLFDEVDRMASIGGKAERLATDNLREVIDRTRDDLPGSMFVYAVPPQFVNDTVPRYPALQQRVQAFGSFSRTNYFSPQINLERLDVDENVLMLTIGEKLIPIFETAFKTDLDRQTQQANAEILANVASDLYLDVNHRRVFVKSFVAVLAQQNAGTEHTLNEAEANAIMRGQVAELSAGDTPPY